MKEIRNINNNNLSRDYVAIIECKQYPEADAYHKNYNITLTSNVFYRECNSKQLHAKLSIQNVTIDTHMYSFIIEDGVFLPFFDAYQSVSDKYLRHVRLDNAKVLMRGN
jgi:hypothetical protein